MEDLKIGLEKSFDIDEIVEKHNALVDKIKEINNKLVEIEKQQRFVRNKFLPRR